MRMKCEDYGIVPDGRDVSKALMELLREHGHAVLSWGVFSSGPIEIPSGAVLEIAEGAELRFIPDFSLYHPIETRWEGIMCFAMHPCILIKDADHVCICGKGRINGSGRPWWERAWYHRDRFHGPEIDIEKELAALNGSYSDQPSGGGGSESQFLRPPLLQMLRSSDASISGVTFVDSPFWTIHSVFSKGIAIRDVRIANPSDAPNTDGIDIESSSDVEVSGCLVDVGDDGIAVKSGSGIGGLREGEPSRSIWIHDCTVLHAHGGAVIGSETAAGVYDVLVEDCLFDMTDRGIRIKTRRRRGGMIRNAVFRNLRMRGNLCPFVINMFYRCGTDDESLFSTEPLPIREDTPSIEGIVVEDCHAVGSRSSAGFIAGLPERPVRGLTIRSSSFAVSSDADAPIADSDMYRGIPVPQSRGFFIANAEAVLDGVSVPSSAEEL